jgi:hypothetical protein
MATKQPGDRATRWLGDRATKPLVDSWPCGVSGTGRRNNATSTSASTLTEVSQDSLLADTSASGELSPKQKCSRRVGVDTTVGEIGRCQETCDA